MKKKGVKRAATSRKKKKEKPYFQKFEDKSLKYYPQLEKVRNIKSIPFMDVKQIRKLFGKYITGPNGWGIDDVTINVTPATFPWKYFEKSPLWLIVPDNDDRKNDVLIARYDSGVGCTFQTRIWPQDFKTVGRFLRKRFPTAYAAVKRRLSSTLEMHTKSVEGAERALTESKRKVAWYKKHLLLLRGKT